MKTIKIVVTIIFLSVLSLNLYADEKKIDDSSTVKYNTDFMGSDIKTFVIPVNPPVQKDGGIIIPPRGQDTCADYCKNNPNCRAWTYVNPNTIQGLDGMCYLKDNVSAESKNNCCVSGTLYEENTDRPGGDYASLTTFTLFVTKTGKKVNIPVTDRFCHSLCTATEQCVSWTFVKPNTIQGPNGICYLKEKIPNAVKNNCCTSGKFKFPSIIH